VGQTICNRFVIFNSFSGRWATIYTSPGFGAWVY